MVVGRSDKMAGRAVNDRISAVGSSEVMVLDLSNSVCIA